MSEKTDLNKKIIEFLNGIFKDRGYKKSGQKRWTIDKGAFALGAGLQSSQWGKQYYINLEMTVSGSQIKNQMLDRLHPHSEINHGGAFDFDKDNERVLSILKDQIKTELIPLFDSISSIEDLKEVFPNSLAVASLKAL
jgi:uncharacterized protein DUF4304